MRVISARARVVRLEGARVWVVPDPEPGCASCVPDLGCSMTWRAFARRPSPGAVDAFPVENRGDGLREGDRVLLAVPAQLLLAAVTALFLVPVTGFLAAASIPSFLVEYGVGGAEWVVAAWALGGLCISALAARRWASSLAASVEPRLLGKVEVGSE